MNRQVLPDGVRALTDRYLEVAGYIAQEFPEWTDLAARAAAHRRGEPASFTTADLLAAADHVDAVVAG